MKIDQFFNFKKGRSPLKIERAGRVKIDQLLKIGRLLMKIDHFLKKGRSPMKIYLFFNF
jgi:hypothetical protein